MNIEPRLGVVNLKKITEQHAAQAPALRERIYPSTTVRLGRILRSLDHVFSVIRLF
jgi:hypothetical protein